MASAIKGPGILLAQFLRDHEPYDNLENISRWVADLGYKGIQVPSSDPRVFDLEQANGALEALRRGRFEGAAVLRCR